MRLINLLILKGDTHTHTHTHTHIHIYTFIFTSGYEVPGPGIKPMSQEQPGPLQ